MALRWHKHVQLWASMPCEGQNWPPDRSCYITLTGQNQAKLFDEFLEPFKAELIEVKSVRISFLLFMQKFFSRPMFVGKVKTH